MNLTVELQGECYIVAVEGAIGIGQIEEFAQVIESVRKKSPKKVIFHLSGTTSLYSAGIGCLLAFTDQIERAGGIVMLAAVPKKIRTILDRTGAGCFRFAPTLKEAQEIVTS